MATVERIKGSAIQVMIIKIKVVRSSFYIHTYLIVSTPPHRVDGRSGFRSVCGHGGAVCSRVLPLAQAPPELKEDTCM